MMSTTPSMSNRMPKTSGTASAATIGEPSKIRPMMKLMRPKMKEPTPPPVKSADDGEHTDDKTENAEPDHDGGRQNDGRKQRMAQHDETGDDADNADDQRPIPRYGVVDEDAHQFEHPDEQPIEPEEDDKRDQGRRRRSS